MSKEFAIMDSPFPPDIDKSEHTFITKQCHGSAKFEHGLVKSSLVKDWLVFALGIVY